MHRLSKDDDFKLVLDTTYNHTDNALLLTDRTSIKHLWLKTGVSAI